MLKLKAEVAVFLLNPKTSCFGLDLNRSRPNLTSEHAARAEHAGAAGAEHPVHALRAGQC